MENNSYLNEPSSRMSHLCTPFDNLYLVALKILTSDHRMAGSNPAGGENLPEPKRRFNAESPPFNRPDTTEILLKGT